MEAMVLCLIHLIEFNKQWVNHSITIFKNILLLLFYPLTALAGGPATLQIAGMRSRRTQHQ